jgi:hypothetical protein
MEATYRTPVWLSGLLIVFILASAAVLGVLQYTHAKKSGLQEQKLALYDEVRRLRTLDGEMQNLVSADGPLVKRYNTRNKLLGELGSERDQANSDADLLVKKCAENVLAIRDATDKAREVRGKTAEEAKERRIELGQVENTLLTNERETEEKRNKLREDIAKANRELDGVRKRNLRENADNDRHIAELNDRIAELTRQREIANQDVKADGKVLTADTTVGFVIIDLGRGHALRKGTKFTVYNRQAGRNVDKGVVEVVKIDDRISTCRVLTEKDGKNPIVPNDLISNPVFDRDKVKGFTIRGSFRHFSKDELRHFIIESGGRYDSELNVATDYLVAGDDAAEALNQANKLGITILSEEQLIESQLFRLPAKTQNE